MDEYEHLHRVQVFLLLQILIISGLFLYVFLFIRYKISRFYPGESHCSVLCYHKYVKKIRYLLLLALSISSVRSAATCVIFGAVTVQSVFLLGEIR